MGFISILNKSIEKDKSYRMPTFMVDLNVDQVIDQIQALWSVPVRKYYYDLPSDKKIEDYRRAIYGDVKKPEVYPRLVEYVEHMQERKEALEKKQAVSNPLQQAIWHMQEVAVYCESLYRLYEGLKAVTLQSEGMREFREYLATYVLSEEFSAMHKKVLALKEHLQSFHIKLVIENNQIVVSKEQVSGEYESYLRKYIGNTMDSMKSPFAQDIHLSDLEQEIMHMLSRQNSSFFDEAQKFYKHYRDYAKEPLLVFADEVSYYLAYYAFQQKMELAGFVFTTPEVDEGKDMSASGLYDIALACASLKSGKKVISNDMVYHNGESFLILTGPNQGGKTTFARSLGQLVYLCKMGLDVPACAANVHYFTGILTHFSVEESVETGRGKLMEELVRLKPMMSVECENSFVIINELFTTAANYDACLMGKRVINHFVEQGCRGIYVTHLKELTQAHDSVVSLRAMLDEQRMQNYKILRQPAEDSVCAINQVNKYRLNYDQLKERLS